MSASGSTGRGTPGGRVPGGRVPGGRVPGGRVPGGLSERAFLDAGAGQPLHPAARAALDRALDVAWADPAGLHHEGRRAAVLLDAARASVARAVGAEPDEVRFVPSGPDAIVLGLQGLIAGRARVSDRLVVGAVEQDTLLAVARRHEAAGGHLDTVGVDPLGRVDVEAMVEAAVDPPVDGAGRRGGPAAAVCLQAANHEVGTRQPVAPVAAGLRRAGVPLLVDATPSLGLDDVPAGWDILTADATRWGGPAGVGVLAVRRGTRWRDPRSTAVASPTRGSIPVPAVVAAAAALEAVTAEAATLRPGLGELVDRIRERVPATVPDTDVFGDPVDRLPHVVTFSCLYVDGEALVHELDAAGVAVGSGSACAVDGGVPSHVLLAMGALSHGNVRVTLPVGVPLQRTREAVERLLAVLPDAVARVRETAGVAGL